jgi:hypothetical protein
MADLIPWMNVGQTIRGIDAGFNNWVDKTDFIPGVSAQGGVRNTNNASQFGKTNTGGASGDWAPANSPINPQQNQVVANDGAYTGGGDGIAATTQVGDPNEVAYWSDQMGSIQRLLGNVDTQANQGVSNINNGFNLQNDRLNQSQSNTLQGYGMQRDQTNKAKVGALDNVDTNARNTYQSLQRILGLAGSGVSSAAKELAPWAVSKEATGNRTAVVDTFGNNLQNIGLAEKDAKDQYSNALQDLASQKNAKLQDFQSGIESQRQSFNTQLQDAATKKAMAGGQSYMQAAAARSPFQQAVNSSQDRLNSLFTQYKDPTFNVREVNAKTPELGQYKVDPMAIGGNAQQNTPAEVAQYLPWLRDDKKLV